MRINARIDGFGEALSAVEAQIERANTLGMRDAVTGLKEELRDDVRAAGLGNRLAGAWQGETYPKSGFSMEPAGYVHSNAPTLINFFSGTNVIVPVGGHPYLAIPSKHVPRRRGGRGGKARMTPFEVEIEFNQDLIVRKGRRGNLLGFVDVIPARNRRGFRKKSAGRVAQGRQSQLVLMFTFVRRVVGRKRLDLTGPAQRWAGAVPGLVAKHWTE